MIVLSLSGAEDVSEELRASVTKKKSESHILNLVKVFLVNSEKSRG